MDIRDFPLPKDIRADGKIAQLVIRPKKSYKCTECGLPTEVGEPHYSVTFAGSGVGGLKYPDRVCAGCIRVHMKLPLTWEDRRRQWGELLDYCCSNLDELECTGRMRGIVVCLQKIWMDMFSLKKEGVLCSK